MKRLLMLCFFITTISLQIFAEKDYDKRITVDFDQEIEIKNVSGQLDIRGWENPEIRIKGTIDSNVSKLIFEKSGNKIVIKPDISRKNINRGKNIDCNLKIYVPVKSSLSINVVSSNIEIVNVESSIQITSIDGDVQIKALAESLDIQTISGRIEIDGSSKMLQGISISGDFLIDGDFPSIIVKSTSGDIKYEGGLLEHASIYSTSGYVSIECKELDGSHIEIGTVSGNIRLDIPRKASVQLSLKSVSGSIRADTDNYDEVDREDRKVRLKRKNGDSIVYIESISGNISIPE